LRLVEQRELATIGPVGARQLFPRKQVGRSHVVAGHPVDSGGSAARSRV